MAGITELLGALRQLNVESKDIVSNPIKAAYESSASRSGPLPSKPPKMRCHLRRRKQRGRRLKRRLINEIRHCHLKLRGLLKLNQRRARQQSTTFEDTDLLIGLIILNLEKD